MDLPPREEPQPFFTALQARLAGPDEISIGELLELKRQAHGLAILLLALPSLVPGLNLGAAPLGGMALVWIGLQMALGHGPLRLPRRIREHRLQKGRVKEALARLEGLLVRLRRPAGRHRALRLRWTGWLVAWTGFLLAMPVPVPFGNVLPAAVLCLTGAALLEERPFWGWLGALGSVGTTVYFALYLELIQRAALAALHGIGRWLP